MADLKIPPASTSIAPRPAVAPARAEAVQAAQRAFFQAALQGAGAPAAKPAQPAQPALAVQPGEPPADRYLRPGSRLDIKV